ncbi:Mov34/MPN/PAD-1 family protein [Magnetospirillum fulvum]|uniref:Proteasome lid subunit RPN8/RPN11, contains Jab1/MPN metalloenzyme (JAMM) motif n=1 Tax=Magnetospirillum fulvum TaxID=1082 RepID=A0A1H6HIW3_MAGFU|nr:M67 family metallopeptidase [Magnetospirillum fulvum]SEH33903.1 Proteasome lid subunit RPN8/RPN11, contains Jab1/MPN metalloenzyme (JAMM) motif [Magnetospirillum fulvum]
MIVFGSADLAAIAKAAEAAFPAEGCGLLIGRGRRIVRVSRVIPADNLERERHLDRFELDPAARFAAERTLRGGPERIVGHWHSHPNGSADPSAEDIARAYEPELIWLIVAVAPGPDGRPQAGLRLAHRLDATTGSARPEKLRVFPDAP